MRVCRSIRGHDILHLMYISTYAHTERERERHRQVKLETGIETGTEIPMKVDTEIGEGMTTDMDIGADFERYRWSERETEDGEIEGLERARERETNTWMKRLVDS